MEGWRGGGLIKGPTLLYRIMWFTDDMGRDKLHITKRSKVHFFSPMAETVLSPSCLWMIGYLGMYRLMTMSALPLWEMVKGWGLESGGAWTMLRKSLLF